MNITVVGAGVIGLTTALTLEERGHRVRVVAAARGDATTSAVAGAVWFPYRVGPRDRVTVWAQHTRRWLVELARTTPAAGVDVLTCYEIADGDGATPPWWATDDITWCASPVGTHAWRYTAPRAQPSLLLPWLEAQLAQPIEQRVVTDLAAEPGDVVVNSTGLGARELAGDHELEPLLGQVVITEPGAADLSIAVSDDRDPDRLFYVIPRRDELVLGGCSVPLAPGVEADCDDAITDRILAQAKRLGIAVGAVRRVRVGLRPYRAAVRLERDGRIVHNYGHGGAGFTLCRGCAEDVAALVA
jgi:D-amino-acid oxidase